MADESLVSLAHPDLGTEIHVHPDAVASWEAQGWHKPKSTKKEKS